MKFKEIYINFFVVLISIYIPLFCFSLYRYLIKSNAYFYRDSQNLEIFKASEGFVPIYWPNQLLENKNSPSFFPIGSIPLRNSYFCNEGYGLITYKTDRFGLRNSDNKWNNVTNKSNIFLIGDSFTQGSCVTEEKTINYYLEKNTKINTINLATGSNGPYEYQAIMKSMMLPIIKNSNKNNIVILIFYPNDNLPINKKKEKLLSSISSIIEVNLNGDVIPQKKYTANINNFIRDNYPLSSVQIIKEIENNSFNNSFKQSVFFQTFSLLPVRRAIRVALIKSSLLDFSYKTFIPSLDAISSLSKTCIESCRPIVAYIPPSNYWTAYLNANKYKFDLIQSAAEYGVLFIDGEDVIDRNNLKNYSPKGEHLSIEGYEKFSKYIKGKVFD